MLIAITERVDDIRHDVDAAHANHVVSLNPADIGRQCGYATVHAIVRIARLGGVAVVVGDDMDGVPDPVKIVVREDKGPDPAGIRLAIRRAGLPVLVRVDDLSGTAVVLRRIRVAMDPAPEPGSEPKGTVEAYAKGTQRPRRRRS